MEELILKNIRFGIKGKLIIVVISLIFITAIILGAYATNNLSDTLYSEKEFQTKEMVEVGMGVIRHFYEKAESGELTTEAAQQQALNVIENMTFGPDNQDYYWINDYEPVMLMHPYSAGLIGEYIGDIQDTEGSNLFLDMVDIVETEGAGFVEYHWQYYDDTTRVEPKLSYVEGFEPWGWILGTGVYIDDVETAYAGMRNNFVIIGLIILGIGFVLTLLIARYIAGPIVKLDNIINSLANFDLRKSNDSDVDKYSSRSDEIGSITNSIIKMKDNLRGVITEQHEIEGVLASSSQELSAGSQEMSASADEVNTAIEQVASGAEEQTAQISETERNIRDLSTKIDSINQMAAEMKEESTLTTDHIEEGNSYLNDSLDKLKIAEESKDNAVKAVVDLEKLSAEIDDIIEIINNIARQTNLLALNASIEAARAGQAGQGFSVVAEEIRELSENTSNSTENISDLIKQIQDKVNEMATDMEKTDKAMANTFESVNKTVDKFDDIENISDSLADQVDKITGYINEMTTNSSEVTAAIQEIAEVSEQASATAEEVAASSSDQARTTEEIVRSAEKLAEMAQNLAEISSRFKL
mgnify:CR=1 FL=1